MDARRWSKVRVLHLEAAGLPAHEREDFLRQACGEDAALRAEVEALLCADSATRATIAHDAPTPSRAQNAELAAGTLLGAWRIERLAGRGGMGEVYEARRADGAFELRAAVKLLKRGLDSDAVVARFNRERRILAQLDHPNIAHVLDAGIAPDGRPFLVMEYVEGTPITEHARGRNLSVPELLRLMITVSQAVQAAHARKIVHRDLKPTNVLVTAQDQVKLLDFGIAKTLAEDDQSEATRLGESSAMTPAYAAPEQLLGLPATPATDVYALGCILYQLLVERLPHVRGGRSTQDIARTLDQETIDRPSTVLRKERGRLPEPQRQQRLKELSADLDVILLKALHPDAPRRYSDAQGFADDLRRLLEDRPVLARPDSAAYRLGRFVRRNRLPVTAALAVVAALSVGLAAALYQAHVATQRRTQADDLINFMLGDLQDRLREVGRLDVLDATIGKAIQYVGTGSVRSADDEALAERVTALTRIAEMQTARGQLKEATATGHTAVDAARELDRREHDAHSGRLLATAILHLADSVESAADFASGATLLAEGLELSRRQQAAHPQDKDFVLLTAKYDAAMAEDSDFGPRQSDQGGDTHWRACIDGLRHLDAQALADPRMQDQLIECEGGWITHLNNFQHFDAAREAASSLVADAQAMRQQYPKVAFLQYDLVRQLSRAAVILARMGKSDLADRPSALAVQIGRQLTAQESGNFDWLHAYAQALLFDLDVRTRLGAYGDAQAEAEQALPLYEKILEHLPDDVGTRLEAMQLRDEWADLDADMKRKDLAVAQTNEGLRLVRGADQATAILVGGELPLLLRRWWYAYGVLPDEAAQAQHQYEAVLRELSTHADAPPLDFYRLVQMYLGQNCQEGDRLREKLLAEHSPESPRVQKYRDAGCGKPGAAG